MQLFSCCKGGIKEVVCNKIILCKSAFRVHLKNSLPPIFVKIDSFYPFPDNPLFPMVVSCEAQVLSNHCYWPFVSDFINILSHKSIAEMFMNNMDLIKLWLKFVQYLTGTFGNMAYSYWF